MRQVLENRLKDPSQYNARGATNETQIITAHGQFQGFGNCPKGIPHYADDDVKAANNPTHALRAEYYQHVQNAITAATESITPTVAGLPMQQRGMQRAKASQRAIFIPSKMLSVTPSMVPARDLATADHPLRERGILPNKPEQMLPKDI